MKNSIPKNPHYGESRKQKASRYFPMQKEEKIYLCTLGAPIIDGLRSGEIIENNVHEVWVTAMKNNKIVIIGIPNNKHGFFQPLRTWVPKNT